MNIIYVPKTASGLNDTINLKNSMQIVIAMARLQAQYKSLQHMTHCHYCGELAFCELHHVIPVWVMAVTYLLGGDAQTYREFYERTRTFEDEFESKDWRRIWHEDNLIALCKTCHIAEQSRVDKEYKEALEAEYPVIFGIRRTTEVLALIQRQRDASDGLVTGT